MSICIVVGTRPGIVKMSPLIRECQQRGLDFYVIHTGQHYSPDMDEIFFHDLNLPPPKYKLKDTSGYVHHGGKTGAMMQGIEAIFLQDTPKVVLVCGDANTNLAAALVARKLHCIVGHVESGLRSYDWRMPEEHNRVMMDHICELLFAPTEDARANLIKDNVRGKIILTGNTIVDAVHKHIELAKRADKNSSLSSRKRGGYVLFTTHREENVDIKETLCNLIDAAGNVARATGMEVLFPIHPRTRKRLAEYNLLESLRGLHNVSCLEPLGYLEMLNTLSNAAIVLTDSGGIQEEACLLQVPCVTLRENTERPETVSVGANVIAGTNPEKIVSLALNMIGAARAWPNPFGNGSAAKIIIDEAVQAIRLESNQLLRF